MSQDIGWIHFWGHGDAITHVTAVLLVLLSIVSWTVIVGKVAGHLRSRRTLARLFAEFWQAPSLLVAVERIRRHDPTGAASEIAQAALYATEVRQRLAAASPPIDANEFSKQTLQQAVLNAQGRLDQGLTFLASVGATAPFIGLFGTVWGIYHALIGLTGASQVLLDRVAGPVGEALIMTAMGLFVAIPAVLAYNGCVRANRVLVSQLDNFAHALHIYLTTGIKPRTAEAETTAAATFTSPRTTT